MADCPIPAPRVRTWKTAVADQGGHMFYGLCLMFAFILEVPAWAAPFLVMTIAVERELEQHQWDITKVGRTDLSFWLLVCLIFDIIYYALKYF